METIDSEKIQQLFTACDINGSGFIELEDLQELCNDLSIPDEELEDVFEQLDQNGDGRVSSREFADGFTEVQRLFTKKARTSTPKHFSAVPGLTPGITPSEKAWESYAQSVGPGIYVVPGWDELILKKKKKL